MRTVNIDFGKARASLNIPTSYGGIYNLETIEEAERHYKNNKGRIDKSINESISESSLEVGNLITVDSHKFSLTLLTNDEVTLMYLQ